MRWTQYFYVAIILLGIFIFTYTFYQIVVVGANPSNGIFSPSMNINDFRSCSDSDNSDLNEIDSFLVSGIVNIEIKSKELRPFSDRCIDGDILEEDYCTDRGHRQKKVSCSGAFDVNYICSAGKCLDTCRDGVVKGSEQCDDGNEINGDGCDSKCNNEFCGDGKLQNGLGEECDDGNDLNDDGCNSLCLNAICGNNILESGEQCDDGNEINGDGCDSKCVNEVCGDGILQILIGEQCDDGNTNGGDGCGPLCYTESCGDDVVQGSEECDDGNNENGDGCNSLCVKEECGDGIIQVDLGEECDELDFNGNSCSDYGYDNGVLECNSCNIDSSKCFNDGVCGNGILESGENCDDGNNENGDGCDQSCNVEGSG